MKRILARVVFTPSGCPTLVAAGNKNGGLYLFRAVDLEASGQPLQALTLNTANDSLGSGGVGGVPAYWSGGRMLFVTDAGSGVPGIAGGVVGLAVKSDCTLRVAWSQPLGGNGQPNSTPTVANGVVYVGEGNGGRVHAYDALSGTPLWDSGVNAAGATYAAPIVANGHLYAASWNGFAQSSAGTVRAFTPGGVAPTVLLGDNAIESQHDFANPGTAEAFQVTAATSGTLGSLTAYVDTTSTSTKAVVGLYTDASGHPGTLLAQATKLSPTAGAWTTVGIASTSIVAGTPYWIAVTGGTTGTLRFRDRNHGGCRSELAAQTGLDALPAAWQSGPTYTDCPISAYGRAAP